MTNPTPTFGDALRETASEVAGQLENVRDARTSLLMHAIIILNEANEAEPEGMFNLMTTRHPIGKNLDDHPLIQVGPPAHDEELDADNNWVSDAREIGPLGLINGFFGTDPKRPGWGLIYMDVDIENRRIKRFFHADDR